MDNLIDLNLIEPLNDFALIQKKPVLGICLGMQLMAKSSEEGNNRNRGLGWVDASVKKFQTDDFKKFKIPHMGWNNINSLKNSALMKNISSQDEFYFVHSFFMEPNDPDLVLNETIYIDKFCSGIEKENIFGVQYHPEKSHDAGQTLLKKFYCHLIQMFRPRLIPVLLLKNNALVKSIKFKIIIILVIQLMLSKFLTSSRQMNWFF